jgi:hypothetical protein
MNVNALRMRPAKERSNAESLWQLMIPFPDFLNRLKRFSIVQSRATLKKSLFQRIQREPGKIPFNLRWEDKLSERFYFKNKRTWLEYGENNLYSFILLLFSFGAEAGGYIRYVDRIPFVLIRP